MKRPLLVACVSGFISEIWILLVWVRQAEGKILDRVTDQRGWKVETGDRPTAAPYIDHSQHPITILFIPLFIHLLVQRQPLFLSASVSIEYNYCEDLLSDRSDQRYLILLTRVCKSACHVF